MRSSLEIYNIHSRETRVVWQTNTLIEAPNFSPDGTYLLVNGEGRLYRVGLNGEAPALLDTGFAVKCNNDHGLSPDGQTIAISDSTQTGQSAIYTLPSVGGMPQLITPEKPSYWHGWSPDGTELAYCGNRNGAFDIYTIPVTGGEEKRLTFGEGHNDGPDYSADGEWIYFNSSRTGLMQIWRIRPDGQDLEQITFDHYNNWFPHPAPKNNKVLTLSYDADVTEHPRDKHVRLRLMDHDGKNLETVFELFGGQGSINVPNWSADGREFAYVRYFPITQ